jgi:hypothetical protein
METLSVGAAIPGLMAAATALRWDLALRGGTSFPRQRTMCDAYRNEIEDITEILSALQGLLTKLSSIPIERADLIQVDHVFAVLSDGILLLSTLTDFVTSMEPASSEETTRCHPQLLTRLCGFKKCVSLMVAILQM